MLCIKRYPFSDVLVLVYACVRSIVHAQFTTVTTSLVVIFTTREKKKMNNDLIIISHVL